MENKRKYTGKFEKMAVFYGTSDGLVKIISLKIL